MLSYRMFWKILIALLVCPLSLLVVWHRKFWRFFWIILLIQFSMVFLLLLLNCIFGEGLRLYYLETYNKDEIRVIENGEFLFYKMGFATSYKLNSRYYVSHRILLIPGTKSVPVQYEFNGKIFIEIYDKNDKLLHSFKTNKPTNRLRQGKDDNYTTYLSYNWNYASNATSTFAFELGEIPFDLIRLKWSRLKSMVVTVLEPEKDLLEFCDKATLVVIPDLRL